MPTKIVSLSNNTKRSLKKIGIIDAKIEIVPPPIDITLFNPHIPKINHELLKINRNDQTLLYIGDLTIKRGLNILIEALSLVVKTHPNVKLFLAVNMPLKKYEETDFEIKKKISSFGLDENVIPLGIVSNMPEIMVTSNIFVAPYLSIESIADYPISILEAMACSTPVIATNVGGSPEILKNMETGLLIEPNDVSELAKSITFLLDNNMEAEKFADASHKYVSDTYSLDSICKKYERIYTDLTSLNLILNKSSLDSRI